MIFLLARWFFLLWVCGWLMLPLSRRVWPHLPDGGLAIGRVLFCGGATLCAFWLGNLGVPVRISAALTYIALFLLALIALRECAALREFARANRRTLLAVETLFFAAFFFFVAIRGFWPDVLWPPGDTGEKPMDIALIASCARADFLPPPNPYAAGTRLTGYYYFGHLQTALLSDMVGAAPRSTYNLMAASVPALCFSGLASLCIALVGSLRGGIAASLAVLACGTLQPLVQWFENRRLWPLDYLATSRVIPFTINEYPFFSFSFADLHAHFFAIPFAVLALSLGWELSRRVQEDFAARGWKIIAVLAACALGVQILVNTWDFPIFAIFLALCLCFKLAPRAEKSTPENGRTFVDKKIRASKEQAKQTAPEISPRFAARRALLLGSAALAIVLGALILASPFLLRLHSEANKPALLSQPASPMGAWLLVWGVPCGAWLVHLALAAQQRKNERDAAFAAFAFCAASTTWLALMAATGHNFFVLIFLIALLVATVREAFIAQNARDAFLARLALCGLLALLWSETTWAGFLGDRNNLGFDDFKRQDTVFKFGLQAWLLLGSAAACAIARHIGSAVNWSWPGFARQRAATWAALCVLSAALCVMFFSSMATTVSRARNFENWSGLDALSHLPAPTQSAAQWLSDNARDGDAIIEAEQHSGGDYSPFTLYAHASGVPTVIGPAAHSFQWGLSWEEVARRKAEVRAFYTGREAGRPLSDDARRAILHLYGARWIVCGALERMEYGDAALQNVEHLFPDVAFQSGAGKARVSIRRAF